MLAQLLENALIYDGSGAPPFLGSLGWQAGRIAWIGRSASQVEAPAAVHRLDLGGLALAPGFIDGHTHAEGYFFDDRRPFYGKLLQGVAVELLGNCGLSIFPLAQERQGDLRDYFGPFCGPYDLDWGWSDLRSLEQRLAQRPPVGHAAALVGHGSLRIAVMGFEERPAAPHELQQMTRLLETAFDQGAAGLSLGLMYPPGLYAPRQELVALAQVAAAYDRPLTVHMRNETFHLLDSVTEMLQIAQASGARLVISHHKAVGKANWGVLKDSLERIEQARQSGLEVFIDVYPYVAGNTLLRALLPPWSLEGGVGQMLARLRDDARRQEIRQWVLERTDWENLSLAGGWDTIMIQSTRSRHEYEGRYLDELARSAGQHPLDFVLDLLLEEEGQVVMLLFTASEDDLLMAMRKPYCMIASDGIPVKMRPHPRLYGTFPRFLSHYVLEKGLMPLEEGLRRITGLPAEVYGLQDRGCLRPGAWADLVAFDPAQFRDRATYTDSQKPAQGLKYMWLEGDLVVQDSQPLGKRNGRFLRP